MKDTARPHPTLSSRSAPYRKRKSSGVTSPNRATRRPSDASRPQGQIASPCPPGRAHGPHRVETQLLRTISFADSEHRPSSGTGGNRAISHVRRHTSSNGSVRECPPHANALSIYADVPSPSLRLPLTSAPPTTTALAIQRKAESPSPGSVTTFLRNVELSDNPASAPPPQTSFFLTPPSLRLPTPLSTQSTNTNVARTNGNGYQVSLVYKGYPFAYDLSALPDDPKGMIALLSITKSDPGPYLLVGAHYRRTGRSRAARAVIKSLLDSLDSPSGVEKGNGNVAPVIPASDDFDNNTPMLVHPDPGSPCPYPPKLIVERTTPGFKGAAMRSAMLLLAACEMDLGRERPDDLESASHVSAAHDLFRAVYGTVNDAIVGGAVRPQLENAHDRGIPSNRRRSSSVANVNGRLPPSKELPVPREAESLARVKRLEKELSTSRAAQKKLQGELTASNDHLMRAENKVHVLESRSRDVLVQLNTSRDKIWELRQRLAESEEKARELAQSTPSTESRVWERLKDLLFDNLGGAVRGE